MISTLVSFSALDNSGGTKSTRYDLRLVLDVEGANLVRKLQHLLSDVATLTVIFAIN